jgi:cryptochrome
VRVTRCATRFATETTATAGDDPKPASAMSTRSLLWFRKGLRVHDNPALLRACDGATSVMPVFVLDPWFMSPARVGGNRVRFLLESLRDLDASLQQRGSRLLVVHGDPTKVIPVALQKWQCTRLCFELDTEPYALIRDAEVRERANANHVNVHAPSSHTLYDMDCLLAKCPNSSPPTNYATFLKLAASLGSPAKPVPAPASIPGTIDGDIAELVALLGDVCTGHGVPTLEELGYEPIAENEGFPARGGETEGLRRLRETLSERTYVAEFKKPSTNPTTLWRPLTEAFRGSKIEPKPPANPFEAAKRKGADGKTNSKTTKDTLMAPATTALSPYMKFGCVSARTFYHELHDLLRELKGAHSKPPESLEGQLLWREFYYLCAFGTPNFYKMEGNRICRQINWTWDQERLEAWENGKTGFPWIDACMKQLKKEGWMHHLSRHAVACFLTRGDLFVHWEAGAAVFDRELVDADYALNNGNWMWLSCSCFFYQYFRVYGPVSFGKKWDKNGDFIRKYLPVLKVRIGRFPNHK